MLSFLPGNSAGDTVKSLADVTSKSTHDVWGACVSWGHVLATYVLRGFLLLIVVLLFDKMRLPSHAAKESDELRFIRQIQKVRAVICKTVCGAVASKQPQKHEDRQTFCGTLFEP